MKKIKINGDCAMTWAVVILRSVIGWHLLYEGMWKLAQGGGWTCRGLLRLSHWIAAPMLTAIAENATATAVCDQLMVWGLVAIGLGLITGVLARYAALAGIALMTMLYVTMPPFMNGGGHSHFLYVDYGVLEACALALIAVRPGPGFWEVLMAIVAKLRKGRRGAPAAEAAAAPSASAPCEGRRAFIAGLTGLPVLGAFGGLFAAKHGYKGVGQSLGLCSGKVEAVTSASYRFEYKTIDDLTKKLDQHVQIGNFSMSRITLGGNLIGGWSHARDLRYVSTLMKAYNTERRIFDTMHLAESCGINTISTCPSLMNFITKYREEDGGTINFVSDCGGFEDKNGELGVVRAAKMSVDAGAKMVYYHGFGVDECAVKNDWKRIECALREMRKLGVPVGIGAHAFSSLKFCVEHDCIPDFWYKTFHPTGYWSASKSPTDAGEGEPGSGKKGWYDNNWCRDPAALSKWFEDRPEPWIAFKTMAAGAVHPSKAMPFVFNGGADAACMGMFDFQVVEDVNIANDYFRNGLPKRARKWN